MENQRKILRCEQKRRARRQEATQYYQHVTDEQLSQMPKKEARMLKNRLSAHRSRQRQKDYTSSLEKENMQLKKRLNFLEEQNERLLGLLRQHRINTESKPNSPDISPFSTLSATSSLGSPMSSESCVVVTPKVTTLSHTPAALAGFFSQTWSVVLFLMFLRTLMSLRLPCKLNCSQKKSIASILAWKMDSTRDSMVTVSLISSLQSPRPKNQLLTWKIVLISQISLSNKSKFLCFEFSNGLCNSIIN